MELGQDAVAATYIGCLRSDAIDLPDLDGPQRDRKRSRVEAPAQPPTAGGEGDGIPAQETATTSNRPHHQQLAARFDIRCNRCLKIGHKAKDCMEDALSKSRCYKCGEEGHAARQCKHKGSLDQFGPRRFEAKRIHQGPRQPQARTHGELDAQLAAYSGGAGDEGSAPS